MGLWFFLSLGLIYTTEGVHAFLAEGTTSSDPLWWAAWSVEPMFAGLLIILLNFESVILSYGVAPNHRWWNRLKHVLLASTLAMNVVPQLMPLLRGRWEQFNLGSLAVHAIIPVIVYGIAEVIPVIQARQRQITLMIYDRAEEHEAHDTAPPQEAQQRFERTANRPIEPAREAEPLPKREPEPSSAPSVPLTPDRATEPAPSPAASGEPAASPPPRKVPGVRLPAEVLDRITTAVEQAQRDGRQPTVADVRAAARVPEDMAARILADLDGQAVPA